MHPAQRSIRINGLSSLFQWNTEEEVAALRTTHPGVGSGCGELLRVELAVGDGFPVGWLTRDKRQATSDKIHGLTSDSHARHAAAAARAAAERQPRWAVYDARNDVHDLRVCEILAPMQQARPLDLLAVITCLYHGVAYDSRSFESAPLELIRREVAFTQPETWTDGGYRLTMRVAVRGGLVSAAEAVGHEDFTVSAYEPSLEAIPVADAADDDVVFGLNFTATTMNIEPPPTEIMLQERHTVTLPLLCAAFPNSFLNWAKSKERDFVRAAKDALTFRVITETKITLELIHTKTPVLFVLSMGPLMIKPDHLLTYQPVPGSDVQHTIAQFSVRAILRTLLQVALLPGSACVLPGSSITIRDVDRGLDQYR